MTKLVGILNITPDSFSDGGKYNSLETALNRLQELLNDGADVIDIGAESTRPTAIAISHDEEWLRLEKILPEIIFAVKKFNQKTGKKIQTSIDSYHFETIEKAHECGVDVINDVKGLVDERIVKLIAKKNIETVLMHNYPISTNPELIVNPYINTSAEILKWAEEKIFYLQKNGVKKSQLIFDLGIGFNKNAQQSIKILKEINIFKNLNLPIYVGHSKKSFLDAINIAGDRPDKTLEISKYLILKKVNFLRIHDVVKHCYLRSNCE